MEIELQEIRDFVSQYHPFDVLSLDELNQLTPQLEIRYIRRNQEFPPQNNQGSYLYMIRSGAVDLLDEQGKLTGKLNEGDVYTAECQLIEGSRGGKHVAIEDTLCYQLACSNLKTFCERSEEFGQFFEADLSSRLQKAAAYNNREADVGLASMTIKIGELIKKKPVTMDVNVSIQEAAQKMSANNVSSLILTRDDKLAGIVTDRDLRRECVAKAMDVSAPISDIMSSGLITMTSNDLVLHALMNMTRDNINHLPVVDEGEIVGMLTASDMTRHSSGNPAYMTTQIRRSHSVAELQGIFERLPNLQLTLANSGVSARHIGETISRLTDGLTVRLIELAQRELGEPPVPFVWVAGGSQARLEQSSHSDQDNALIISDDLAPADEAYFEKLANWVCDGLNACGFVYCPGSAMASNEKWRQPYSIWEKYFRNWIETPEPMALMLSSIFFDLRPVHGDFALHKKLQNMMLELTVKNRLFISHMVSNALKHRPPLGFFRTFVLINDGEHDNTFDIKHRGIVPITDIARVLGLAEGIGKVNTTERLQALAGTKSMSADLAENLTDALEFIANLRIQHQAEQIRRGLASDNFVPPDDLSSLERKHLKASFEIIKEAQDSLGSRFTIG